MQMMKDTTPNPQLTRTNIIKVHCLFMTLFNMVWWWGWLPAAIQGPWVLPSCGTIIFNKWPPKSLLNWESEQRI